MLRERRNPGNRQEELALVTACSLHGPPFHFARPESFGADCRELRQLLTGFSSLYPIYFAGACWELAYGVFEGGQLVMIVRF